MQAAFPDSAKAPETGPPAGCAPRPRWRTAAPKPWTRFAAREFDAARAAFAAWPDDPAAQFYAKLAQYYGQNPPPADWDGRFASETK